MNIKYKLHLTLHNEFYNKPIYSQRHSFKNNDTENNILPFRGFKTVSKEAQILSKNHSGFLSIRLPK